MSRQPDSEEDGHTDRRQIRNRERHRNPRKRQRPRKGGDACPAVNWEAGHARNEAEPSGLLGQGYRPWGGFLS